MRLTKKRVDGDVADSVGDDVGPNVVSCRECVGSDVQGDKSKSGEDEEAVTCEDFIVNCVVEHNEISNIENTDRRQGVVGEQSSSSAKNTRPDSIIGSNFHKLKK